MSRPVPTQLNASPIILEILPELQGTLDSLDRLYVKSPLTGAAVPLSTLVDIDTSKVGPLQVTHQGQFPSVALHYIESSPIRLLGPVTGRSYDFSQSEPSHPVDVRDAAVLIRTGPFRRSAP